MHNLLWKPVWTKKNRAISMMEVFKLSMDSTANITNIQQTAAGIHKPLILSLHLHKLNKVIRYASPSNEHQVPE